MRIRTVAALAGTAPLLVLSGALGPPAAFAADSGSTTLQANLSPVPTNMVNGSGTATVTVTGDTLKVTIHATGLDKTTMKGLPAHAQHIHIGGTNSCPVASMASQHNGHTALSVTDGMPAYGAIQVSLTTTGDTSPNSALALPRFPTTPTGTEDYSRSITVNSDVAQQVAAGKGVVVIHGIDYLHNGSYKDLGPSELNPSLPLEGTAPALCGQLAVMPSGGVATGVGNGGSGTEALLGLGAAAVVAAGGVLIYRRRFAHSS